MHWVSLPDFVLPPPIPAIVSTLLIAGVAGISNSAIRRFKPQANICEELSAFILTFAILGAAAHALVLAHAATIWNLRLLAYSTILWGCWILLRRPPRLAVAVRNLSASWRAASLFERGAYLAIAATAAGLILASAGPVTDPDSLDYHLGVPVEWLRQGGLSPQLGWMTLRLAGLGEGINLLGLAAGTDGLGAAVQVSGLIALLIMMGSLAKSLRDRLFALLLALPPAILQLATTQKPLLFPAAGIVIAMTMAPSAESAADFVLIFGLIAFAMASKASFFVSGGIVAIATLVWAAKHRVLPTAALCAAAAVFVLLSPVLGRNYFLYGDPVSPFLENLRSHPDPSAIAFAANLRNANAHTAVGISRFILSVLVPPSLGDVQTVLGVGIFAVLLISWTETSMVALAASAVVLFFVVTAGQLSPRFLLEPYFWCAAAAVRAPWSRVKSVLFHALAIQSLAVAGIALFTAALLFPGALTPGLRQRVMSRFTFGYQEALWLDRVLPSDAILVSVFRIHALYPRPFTFFRCSTCDTVGSKLIALSSEQKQPVERYVAIRDIYRPEPPENGCLLKVFAGPEAFPAALRNPFHPREYPEVAVRLFCE